MFKGLSPRDEDVLLLHAEGLCYKEIAARLGISYPVVKHHASHILQALNANNMLQAFLLAYDLRRSPR